jgi:GntR family transcriptional regulator
METNGSPGRVTLLFQIKPSSGVPIYRQLIDQVHRLVASGALEAGQELPSVRQVAGHFGVNPMTISKAYSLLEAAGVLERVRGKGMIVAPTRGAAKSSRKRMELLAPVLREAATQANQLGLSKEEVLRVFAAYLEEPK